MEATICWESALVPIIMPHKIGLRPIRRHTKPETHFAAVNQAPSRYAWPTPIPENTCARVIFRIACNVYNPAGNTSCSTKCPGIRAVSGKFQAFDTNAEIQYNRSWLKIGFLYANRRQLPARTSNAEPLRSSAMLFWPIYRAAQDIQFPPC